MLKASGKPFVTVALEEGRYSARAILTDPADQALLSTLDEIFPDENTALRYEKDYENILYRIHKIESVFNVTENVMSDFICEERPDGLALVDYIGNKTEVYIPEKIGNSEIVEISAAFPNAATLFIPKTVKRILPSPIPEDTYEDLEALETTSYFRMMEASFGGFAETPRLFGTPSQLAAIYVDNDNPYFYDRNGVLYSRDNTLLRFPPNCPHTEGVLDGVVKIGDGAFADCNVLLDFDFPDTVEAIGDGAFANTSFQLMELGSSLKTVGASAFNEAATNMLFFLPDSVHTLGDWTYRNLRTPGDLSANFLFSNVETIPRGACFGADIRTVLFSGMPKHIEDGAFALCSQLQSMELQEGVLTIGDRAFVGCAKMTHIILPKSLVHIGEDAFLDCDKLKVIRYMGTTMQFLQLYLENPFLSDEQLSLVVCNNQPFRRLSAFRLLKKIEKARALLDD